MTGSIQKQVQLKSALTGLAQLTPAKRIGLLLGLAVCLALIFYLLSWTDSHVALSAVQANTPGISYPATAKNAPATDTNLHNTAANKTTAALQSKHWFASWNLERLIFAGLLAILFLLGVVRPVMRDLARLPSAGQVNKETPQNPGEEKQNLTPSGKPASNERLEDYSVCLDNVRSMVRDNPKRVAQLLKIWINENSTNRN